MYIASGSHDCLRINDAVGIVNWMKTPATFHTHSIYCDGQDTPRTFIDQAILSGLDMLGFSSHAPIPFPVRWAMPREKLPHYLACLRTLAIEYSRRIDVRIGMEFDYIPEITSPAHPWFGSVSCDYRIGSVHFCGRYPNGRHWAIDASEEEFRRGVEEIYGGSVRRAVEVYYELVSAMARHFHPDIIGHFDYPKLYNRDDRFFRECDAWYIMCVDRSLQSIASTDARIELNTGGVTRGRTDEQYPSAWILERCKHYGIPVTLGSDAHSVLTLTTGLPEAETLLESLGLRPGIERVSSHRPLRWLERYSWL